MSANGSIYAYTDQNGQHVRVKDTSLSFRGAHSTMSVYAYRDVVDFGGDQYIALAPVTGTTPPTDIWRSGLWSGLVLVQQGTDEVLPSFLDLSDTPSSYGQPGDAVVVASNGTALAFRGPAYFRTFHSSELCAGGFTTFLWLPATQSQLVLNHAAGVFTCVIPGVYHFGGSVAFRVNRAAAYLPSAMEVGIKVNGSTINWQQYKVIGAQEESVSFSPSTVVALVPGDAVTMYALVGFAPSPNTDLFCIYRDFYGFLT